MPNYCETDVYFNVAIDERILGLIGGLDYNKVDFGHLLPYVDPELDEREWRKDNWGTASKGLDAVVVGRRMTFRTSWTPPNRWLIALAKRLPETTIWVEWFGRGSGQCGGYMLEGTDLNDEAIAGEPIDVWSCNDYRGHRGG